MKLCLIVDDSRVVRKVARRIVEDLGLECEESEDGEKAFHFCQTRMPDVIILDWNMPIMSESSMTAPMYPSSSGGTTSETESATRSETSAKGPIDMWRDEHRVA